MKKTIALIVSLFLVVPFLNAAPGQETQPAYDLASRVIPRSAAKIDFEIVPGTAGNYYEFEAAKGKLAVKGDCVNSLAMGLGDYLRDYCHISLTWFSRDAVKEPRSLPSTNGTVRRSSLVPNRFFLNYCTYGYTIGWWNWEQWERLIDWMAMNGVTMALANTGQESVWQKVWNEFGLTLDQTREYFPGPSFLSWHRMTNMDSWHGPLPQIWLDGQQALQKRIIERELSLGISPILGSFTGHVPRALKDIYPDADIKKLSAWGRFEEKYNPWYLSPMDPLYAKIQKAYLKTQREMYGDDVHVYGIDLFNEVDPPYYEAEYLSNVAKNTWEVLAEIDPDAVWLQMSWLFYHKSKNWTKDLIKAYLEPVPQGHLLMLDYYCEKKEIYPITDSFFGQDFIWSYLGNFGGNLNIQGPVKDVSAKMDRVLEVAPNCKGIGCTLEGLDVNQQMYEYVLGRAWQRTGDDLQWYQALADRHFSKENAEFREAWRIMYDKVQKSIPGHYTPFVTMRPNLKGSTNWNRLDGTYDNKDLLEAWAHVCKAGKSDSPAFRFDCVNIGRQCLDNYFSALYGDLIKAYKASDGKAVREIRAGMDELLADIETLVRSDEYFLLGRWISEARQWGETAEQKDYFEWDSKDLLSCWGFKGGHLTDYANRCWDGMISTYYAPRWDKFFDAIEAACPVEEGVAPVPFNEKEFALWCAEFEWNWIGEKKTFRTKAEGNPYKLSCGFFKKYEERISGR